MLFSKHLVVHFAPMFHFAPDRLYFHFLPPEILALLMVPIASSLTQVSPTNNRYFADDVLIFYTAYPKLSRHIPYITAMSHGDQVISSHWQSSCLLKRLQANKISHLWHFLRELGGSPVRCGSPHKRSLTRCAFLCYEVVNCANNVDSTLRCQGAFYYMYYGIALIPAWIRLYNHYKVWNEITYPCHCQLQRCSPWGLAMHTLFRPTHFWASD